MDPSNFDSSIPYTSDLTFGQLLNVAADVRGLLEHTHLEGGVGGAPNLAPPMQATAFQRLLPHQSTSCEYTSKQGYDGYSLPTQSGDLAACNSPMTASYDIHQRHTSIAFGHHIPDPWNPRSHDYGSYHPTPTFDPNIFDPQRTKRHSSPGHTSHRSFSSSESGMFPGSSYPTDAVIKSRRGGSLSSHQQHRSTKKGCRVSPNADERDEDARTCSSRCTVTPPDGTSKKQNHSEIEKRRRDKMNTYITELSRIVPVCGGSSRKLDKLTVLRMTVEHMKSIRGAQLHSYNDGNYKPSCLSDADLKRLIIKAADGFLFVVGCDRGRFLYVSESVSRVLNYHQSDLLGKSWFDILHPSDVAKVKEQLNDMAPREKLLVDIRTMLPVKGNPLQHHWGNRFCPGARRAFFCRMKCKPITEVKHESVEVGDIADANEGPGQHIPGKASAGRLDNTLERKYSMVYCTGYMKPWPKMEAKDAECDEMDDNDTANLSCLIAVGRVQASLRHSSISRPLTYGTRHSIDGKFVFVDPRATLVHGFLPQELIGTSMFDFIHAEDVPELTHVHKLALQASAIITTPIYRFRTSDSTYLLLQSEWKAFRNPFTRDIEFVVTTNKLISPDDTNLANLKSRASCGAYLGPPADVGYFNDLSKDVETLTPQPVALGATAQHLQTQNAQMYPPLFGLREANDDILGLINPLPESNFQPAFPGTSLKPRPEATFTNLTMGPTGQSKSFTVTNQQHFPMAFDVGLPFTPDDLRPTYEMEGDLLQEPPTCPTGRVPDETDMAVIMRLLEGDGGASDPTGHPWSMS